MKKYTWTTLLAACTLITASNGFAAQELDLGDDDLSYFNVVKQFAIGHGETSLPFSFLDLNHLPQGYSVDICNRIADTLKSKLGNDKIRVRYNPITTTTRFMLVKKKFIDLSCATDTPTAEREKFVSFSTPIAILEERLVTKKEAPIKSLADLSGKSIIVLGNSTQKSQLDKLNSEQGANVKVIEVPNYLKGIQLIELGKADGFYGPFQPFVGELVRRNRDLSTTFVANEYLRGTEPAAIVISKDRPWLKQFVNEELARMARSGELEKIYNRWFMNPVSPGGKALNIPISTEWKALFNPDAASSTASETVAKPAG